MPRVQPKGRFSVAEIGRRVRLAEIGQDHQRFGVLLSVQLHEKGDQIDEPDVDGAPIYDKE